MNEENKTETGGAAHCEIGPSSLPARAVCPCHEPAPSSAERDSGTRAHAVVEVAIRDAVSGGNGDVVAEIAGVTDDEIGRGVWGANAIRRLREETEPDAPIYLEMRVPYALYAGDDGYCAALQGKFGTVDAHWESADGETLYIADFKTYATSDGEKNYLPQGMMYAALIASNTRKPRRAVFFVVAGGDRAVARYDFTIEEAINQTAATIRRVEAIRRGVVFDNMEEARARCGKPSAWCKTCAHAGTCPAVGRAVSLVSGGGILTKPLAARMAIVSALESFVKRVRAEVKAELDAGRRVYDPASGIEYGYAERKGKARLADLKGLAGAVIGYGVTPDDFAANVTVSKTAVDGLLKAVDEAAGRKVKKADREAVYAPFFAEPGVEKYVKRIS